MAYVYTSNRTLKITFKCWNWWICFWSPQHTLQISHLFHMHLH